ncbi:MAG: transposase [Bacteroidetes bacterium]|nr:transposase [Bacteroidota bacterium]
MPYSNLLFDLAELPPAVKYEKFFENLPMLQENIPKTGRHPISRNCMLKALIYKSLRRFPYLTDLSFELNNNPSVSKALGFNPLKPAPSTERFSSFLHDTKHHELISIHQQLVQELITVGVLSGNSIAIDSCPIVTLLKENNLKTSITDRFDKTKKPAGDPEARLGVLIHFPTPFKKEVRYFWGYRNHVINDTATELPIWEITKPANVSDIKVAKDLIQEARSFFNLTIQAVMGDANYDSENLLRFIINDLNALAIIPHNPRNEQPKGYQIKGDKVICEAGLEMYRKGKMRPKKSGILYCQYTCPIIYNKQIRYQHITCPVLHPKFFKGKGCNVLIRMEPNIRSEIDYNTQEFKELYKKRTSVERIFSRLLAIAMQNPTVRGYNANCNHATIAHISVLLVALTAYRTGQQDKIRFVKSFVPNFLT